MTTEERFDRWMCREEALAEALRLARKHLRRYLRVECPRVDLANGTLTVHLHGFLPFVQTDFPLVIDE